MGRVSFDTMIYTGGSRTFFAQERLARFLAHHLVDLKLLIERKLLTLISRLLLLEGRILLLEGRVLLLCLLLSLFLLS
jgi:hypothetical protein